MITSAQIREHKFELSSDGAYTAESVDNYMNELSAEFDSLYSENREIIKRLSVFAKKIEDYKRSEGVVADTLLTAQKSASQTIAGAADVVDKMLESAKGQGKKIIEAAHREADSIKLDRDVIITEAQKTAQEIAKNAAENAQNIISAADEKAREITDKAQADADALMQEVKDNTDGYIKQANEENEAEISRRLDEAQNNLDESDSVLENAKTEADLIKEEAENIRAEAQKILDEARAKAQEIISSANAQHDEIIKKAHEESAAASSDENMTENNSADSGEHTEETPSEESELNQENDTAQTAVEVEAEKIGNINDEKDIEKIEEEVSSYSDESDVYIAEGSLHEDVIINDADNAEDSADGSDSDGNGESFDEFFSDDWNDVNVIENDVPAAVDSFTLDMNAFGDDDDVSDSQANSDVKSEPETTAEEKPDETKAEESVSDVSDRTEDKSVNSVKRDTVNPFDATGSDNIDDENDVLSDFKIDFSIFEEDPDKEIKPAGKQNEKKNSKKSKRSKRK